MDQQIEAVLAAYHHRMEEGRELPREGHESGGQDLRMYAVGPATGRFINLLAASLPNPSTRKAGKPGPKTRWQAARVSRRMPGAGDYSACVLRQ